MRCFYCVQSESENENGRLFYVTHLFHSGSANVPFASADHASLIFEVVGCPALGRGCVIIGHCDSDFHLVDI